ncbi:MAG: TonB-dependent receptor [Vicinamibacterales bacterium]
MNSPTTFLKTMQRFLLSALAAGLVALVPAVAQAQETVTLRGSVVDESGGAIAGAAVQAIDAAGTVRGRAVSDSDGSFQMDVQAGSYMLDVTKDLFDARRVEARVGPGGAPVRIALAVATVREVVSVGAPKVDERPTGQIVTAIDRSVIKDVTGFSVAEIITYSPGVTVQQANGPRDVLISVRGSNSRSTFGLRNIQVFEDGFNVTQPDGLARTDLIDPHAYGGIDVARGPSSSLYGNYAIEGAINFRTRRPDEVNGIEIGQDIGSFGYRNSYVTYGHKAEQFEVFAFGSGVVGSGFTAHTSFQTWTANVLATYTPSKKNRFVFKFINNDMYPNLSIRLSLNQFNRNPYQEGCATLTGESCASASVFANGFAGTRVSLSPEQVGTQRHDRRTIVGARWEHLLDDQTTWRTQLVWDVKDIKQPTGATAAYGATPSFNLLSDVTRRATLGGRPAIHFVGLSANFLNNNGQTYNVAPGGNATLGALTATTYGHVSNIGMRAREEVRVSPAVTTAFGVGVERSELTGRNTGYTYSATATPTLRRTDAERRITNIAPEATLKIEPNRTIRFQARVGTAYGTPQVGNLFVTPEGVNGNNTELKSQGNVGIDTGVDISTRSLTVGLATYYEWYRNELLTQSPGVNLLSYTFNAPRSIHKGFETTVDWQPLVTAAPGLRFRLSHTWMDQVYDQYVERLSAGAFSREFDRAGNKIPGITPNSLVSRLGYDLFEGRLAGLGGHVEYTYRDAMWLDNANLIKAPGYSLVHLNLHYDGRRTGGPLKGLHLLFEVRNVTDKVWVASAGNLSNSLSATTGLQNDATALANSGGIYAGHPRSFFTGVRVGF